MFLDNKIAPNTTVIGYDDGYVIYTDENRPGVFCDESPEELVVIGGIHLDPSYTPYKGKV